MTEARPPTSADTFRGSVVLASPRDHGAGAERAALSLHQALLAHGADATLAVDRQTDPTLQSVTQLDFRQDRNAWSAWCEARARTSAQRGNPRVGKLWRTLGRPRWLAHKPLDLDHPATRNLERLADLPRVLHLHNLENWFDYRDLPRLSQAATVCLTLHDQALLHGYGSYLQADTLANPAADPFPKARKLKADLWKGCRLHICAPSQWMLNAAQQSIFAPAIASATRIPYGIELDAFHPATQEQRTAARQTFDLEADDVVALFCAHNARTHPHKRLADAWQSVKAAADNLTTGRLVLAVVGDDGPPESHSRAHLRFLGRFGQHRQTASAYHAADFLLHTAVRDNFPFAVLEALACGLPVVARSVGGVAEQFDDHLHGRLVDPGAPQDLAGAVAQLATDAGLRSRMSVAARSLAEDRYAMPDMVERTLAWYAQAQAAFSQSQEGPAS